MRRLIMPMMMILMLAVLHTPLPAQALFFDLFPSTFLDLGASEPVMLILTGLALLGLGRVGPHRPRDVDLGAQVPARRPVPARGSDSARRAA
jgi:hypothetical protein